MANEGEYSGRMPHGLTIHVTAPPNSLKYLCYEFLVGERIEGFQVLFREDPDFAAIIFRDLADAIERTMREHRRNQINEKKTART